MTKFRCGIEEIKKIKRLSGSISEELGFGKPYNARVASANETY